MQARRVILLQLYMGTSGVPQGISIIVGLVTFKSIVGQMAIYRPDF